MSEDNFYNNLPLNLSNEVTETLFKSDHIRIERIISRGQSSPDGFWYDQAENEWLMVLQGEGVIRFEDKQVTLASGDYLHIPAHVKHRVEATSISENTLWLAIFYT